MPATTRQSARNPSPSTQAPSQTVLLAVTGMSPAVLTETVWALAQESPPVIPDVIVPITTIEGERTIKNELLSSSPSSPSVWSSLRLAILGEAVLSDDRLMLSPARILESPDRSTGQFQPLADIHSAEDNAAAADFILHELRRWTETPGTRIVASIAGGRKTMGALLAACLSLIGRENDRLTHVLVNPPFDDPRLSPRFYFPAQDASELRVPNGSTVRTAAAQVHLADLPFVPFRNLFERDLVARPASFAELVNRCRTRIQDLARRKSKLVIWLSRCEIEVNGVRLKTARREHLLLLFLARAAAQGHSPLAKQDNAIEPLLALGEELYAARDRNSLSDWRDEARLSKTSFGPQELRKALNELRQKLRSGGQETAALLQFLPQRGRFSLDLPAQSISIRQ